MMDQEVSEQGEAGSDAAQAGRTGIRALARHLDVSIGTVSRALNGRSDVNPETRRRIIEAAERLGYVPNHSGRSLRQGTTGAIGLVWHITDSRESYGEPFFVGLFDGIQSALREHGHDLVILLAQDEDECDRVRRVVDRGLVDALILPWTRTEDPRLDEVAARRFPFITLGRSRSGGEHDWIDLDFHRYGLEATRRLIGFGHRRIGVVTAGNDLMQGTFFIDGIRQALNEAGLPANAAVIAESDLNEADGYQATADVMRLEAPTALLFINHQMAFGAYRRLAEMNLTIGRDVSVIGGVMDTAVCRMLDPPLTCFDLSTFDLGVRVGHAAMARLRARQGGRPTPLCQELWPLSIVERQSDGPAPIRRQSVSS